MTDTNFYLRALKEFQDRNPFKRRSTDLSPSELSRILLRAQELKDKLSLAEAEQLALPAEDEMERARR